MNNRTLKNAIILSIFLICVFISNSVFAAGSFSVNKSTATLKEGKTTTFTIDGSNATGRVNITSSDSTVATVSSASTWLEKNSSTITITAKKAGTTTITVIGKVSDEKGAEATITKTIAVTVEAEKTTNSGGSTNNSGNSTGTNNGTTTEQPKTKSTNAYLSTLGITPKEYDFSGFKKTNLNYSVTIPYEVDSLKVLYKTADSNATVKVTGNSGFEVGSNNTIKVKVTAEDGKTTKTYKIKVTKLAEEEEKPGNVIDDEVEEVYLTALSIKGIDIYPEFSKEIYAYTATLEKTDITEVEVNAVANKENVIIDISGNTELIVGENTINIVVKQKDSTVQTVYQITLTKEAAQISTIGEESNFMSNLIDNIKNYVIIAVIVVVLIIASIVILIVLLRREDKKLKDEKTKEEYNVYENDEKEFEDNQIQEVEEKTQIEEITNETETKNKGRRTRRKEKGRHSK